jgi:hypothetical protein
MSLPPFEPPSLAELREWYIKYRHDENVRRLILEVQRSREQMPSLSDLLKAALVTARRGGFDTLSTSGGPLYEAAARVSAECSRVSPQLQRKPGFA